MYDHLHIVPFQWRFVSWWTNSDFFLFQSYIIVQSLFITLVITLRWHQVYLIFPIYISRTFLALSLETYQFLLSHILYMLKSAIGWCHFWNLNAGLDYDCTAWLMDYSLHDNHVLYSLLCCFIYDVV